MKQLRISFFILISLPLFVSAQIKESDIGTPTTNGGLMARHFVWLINDIYGSDCSHEQLEQMARCFTGACDVSEGLVGKNTIEAVAAMKILKQNSSCPETDTDTELCRRYAELNYGKRFRDLATKLNCHVEKNWPIKAALLSCDKTNYAKDETKDSYLKESCRYTITNCKNSSLQADEKLKDAPEQGYGLRCYRENETCLDPKSKNNLANCRTYDDNGFYKLGTSYNVFGKRIETVKPRPIPIDKTAN